MKKKKEKGIGIGEEETEVSVGSKTLHITTCHPHFKLHHLSVNNDVKPSFI